MGAQADRAVVAQVAAARAAATADRAMEDHVVGKPAEVAAAMDQAALATGVVATRDVTTVEDAAVRMVVRSATIVRSRRAEATSSRRSGVRTWTRG